MKNHFLFFCSLIFMSVVAQQKPIFVTAQVQSATVYFNSAELNQSVRVNLPKGTSEIVIKNVSDNLNENTVQVAAPSTVTVLSVQYTLNYISEYEPNEQSTQLKTVRDSIKWIEKEILKVTNARDSEQKTIELLDKNLQVYGQNSGLNVAELIKMTNFYKSQRTERRNAYDALDEKRNVLSEKLTLLKNKIEINNAQDEKNSRGKLVLQVMNEVAGMVELQINYLSGGASWTPFYDLRAESIANPIDMLYKAQVVQNTGIDWKKIKLSLSSGIPNQNNQAPEINPWFLRYEPQYADEFDNQKLNEVVVTSMGIKKEKKAMGYAITQVSTVDANIRENQLNISFDIDLPYDISSNGKAHSVLLKALQLPVSYQYFAAPCLEKDAFLMAKIADYSKYNLLPGQANIIFEGLYVGKTMIRPNQTSDTLTLSMGRDKRISIKRDKIIDKSGTKFLSSKKEQIFTYDITMRNNKKDSVNLLLNDQYPISTEKEIEVELLEDSNAKTSTETGIMNWELNLKPNETKKLRISYKIKSPKDKTISNL